MNPLKRAVARNSISLAATLCLSVPTAIAHADVVMDWNATAAALPIAAPPVLARVMAATHGAIHDALNAIEPQFETYRFRIKAPADASRDAAVASAAHAVLSALVPGQKAALDATLTRSLAQMPEGPAKTEGIAVGRTAAELMLAWRAKDKFDAKGQDRPGTEAGAWQRTPPGLAPGALPSLGGAAPFLLKSVDQFSAKGRPALTSREFARDMDEIKRLGGRHSTERTAEQTAVAVFWSGNEIPQLNAAARAVSEERKLSPHENARMFALLHMAAADTIVVAFRIKYKENAWRPVTAIRAGYGALSADPQWESLLITPNHPDYPSGHCIVTGAAAQVVRDLFGSDQVRFSYVYPPGLGMWRSYTSWTQIEKEMEDARAWAGIHFRTTNEHSTELGRKVGAYAVSNFLRPLPARRDARKPEHNAAVSR